MATKVVVCPECESPVEAGRFSCSSCGAVVAAVASVSRSFAPAPAVAPPPVEEVAPEAAPPASVVADRADPADDGWDLPEADVEPDPVPEPADATEPAPAAAEPAAHVPAPPATSWPEPPQWPDPAIRVQPIPRPNEASWPAAATTGAAVEPSPTGPMWPAAAATPPAVEPSATGPMWPAATATAPAIESDPRGPMWPAGSAAAALAPADAAPPAPPAWPPTGTGPMALEPPVRTPAGAYLPPSAVLPPGEALPVNGHHTNGQVPQPAATKPSRTIAERLALGDAEGPLGLPVNAAGRTIALGAAIAGLGFLLPWAEIVIGSASMGGFLDMWGLAGPGHPIVLLLLIGIGFLAVAHEKWPVRVGAGTAAIVLGSVLLGLAFPYVMGPFREAVGVYVTAAGAVIMIAGGLLARVPRRHADDEARV